MKGLTDYQKFKLIRPLPDNWPVDGYGVPFLKPEDFSDVDWEKVVFTSFTNRNTVENPRLSIPLMFHFDDLLTRIYSDPLKYINDLSRFLAVPTLDLSAYRNMALWKIEENVRRSLWLGATMQSFGVRVIPTITWANEDSYDICFSHIPYGSVVAISTVGVSGNEEAFLAGFNEMKRRINPSLIIVRGKKIEGMTGKFIFVSFRETFNRKSNLQVPLFNLKRIETIPEGGDC